MNKTSRTKPVANVLNVMVVEDDQTIVKLYKHVLPPNGIRIIQLFIDGKGVVESYKRLQEQIDLVILDNSFPNGSGLEIAREILAHHPEAAILFVTGDLEHEQEAMELGARGFCQKPFNINALIEAIRSAASTQRDFSESSNRVACRHAAGFGFGLNMECSFNGKAANLIDNSVCKVRGIGNASEDR